jgi:3-oxoacyl-[acyl-carrier-protein] synthase III
MEALTANGCSPADIKVLIPHQANFAHRAICTAKS